jgi:hypothetical protein
MNMGISNEMLPAMHNPWFSHRMIEMLQEKCPHLVKLSWGNKKRVLFVFAHSGQIHA